MKLLGLWVQAMVVASAVVTVSCADVLVCSDGRQHEGPPPLMASGYMDYCTSTIPAAVTKYGKLITVIPAQRKAFLSFIQFHQDYFDDEPTSLSHMPVSLAMSLDC